MGCLNGIGIVFGNTAPHNIQNLADAAAALGATVFPEGDSWKATYLIAGSVLQLPDGTDPYLGCIQVNPNVTVVTTEWLAACEAEQHQVSADSYILAPFSGIKATITNFGAKERDTVVAQLKQGGAHYSPELFRHTTHLVGNRIGGNKYKHAREWGIIIVHYDWVLGCLKAGHRLDERPYDLDAYIPRDGDGVALVTGGELKLQTSSVVPGQSESAAEGGAASSGAAFARGGSGGGGLGALATAKGPVPQGTEGPGGVSQAKGLSVRSSAGVPSFAQPAEQYFHVPAIPPDECYFLHWVRLWVVGCMPVEQPHVLAAVRESGATREPMLHSGVTHIVFGSVLSTTDLAEVRQHLQEHREQVKLARLSWLYECVERRAYMEPEGPYAMTVAQLLLAQGCVGTGQLLPAPSGRVGHRSREGSPAHTAGGQSSFSVTVSAANTTAVRLVAPFDDYVPLDPESNPRTMDSFTVRSNASGVFSGLWFTFLAVVGSEDEPIATKLVRQGGGMIMSASTEKTVREPQRRYAVCPFSLPQVMLDRICSNRSRDRGLSEFERVPVEQRVTVSWLRACVTQGSLLPVKRETPLFRPLPHALPLPRFQGLVLAVSQYHREQREVLEELISRLGGTYTETLNKRCQYLVIQDAQGEKFTHAIKWGIPCVRADWVLESAYAGRPLDDQLFAFLPAGITVAEMEERRAAASRMRGTAGGPSQLGPTQRPLSLHVSQLPSTLSSRGIHGSSQYHADNRPTASQFGLPPRPSQASDRHGSSAQLLTGAPLNSGPPPLPMAPPCAPSSVVGAARTSLPAAATAATADTKPQSILEPVMKAILREDVGELDGWAVKPLPACRPEEPSQVQLSGNQAQATLNPPLRGHSTHVPPAAPATAGPAGPASCRHTEVAAKQGEGNVAGLVTASRSAPKGIDVEAPPHILLTAEVRQQQDNAPTLELHGATAMLMQFLNNNKFVPEMACSQLDLPIQLPIAPPPPGVGEGSGAGASSMSSREAGNSRFPLKPTDGDGITGGIGGRRSRKRAAPAMVGELQGAPGKLASSLPGRRARNDEEDEGFVVAMSQQVSYESVAAAPPPRTTRSSARGRGCGGSNAKETLIKAVQGNIR